MFPSHIIIFSRFPQPGNTKTRLIPALGADGAAHLQQRLTEKTVGCARELAQEMELQINIHFSGGSQEQMVDWLGEGSYYRQQGKDLGGRMANSFLHCFAEGAKKAILVGSDIPGLNHHIIKEALQQINSETISIGPSSDGGYYLLGLHHSMLPAIARILFSGMAWSTPEVFPLTSERILTSGYRLHLLPELLDIDQPQDLDQARQEGLL